MPPDAIHLERAGLELELEHRPEDGIVLADQPGLEPLVWLVNRLATGDVQPVPDDVALEDESLRQLGSLVEPLAGGSFRIFSPGGTVDVDRDVLWEVLDALMARRLTEPFWLFRPDPVFWRPSAADRELAAQLEPEARRLGEEAAEGARSSARRRLLLAQLEAAGVLEAGHGAVRSRWLEAWAFDSLLAYQQAAMALADYSGSNGRERVFAGLARSMPAQAHVSLDWFRQPEPGAPEAGGATWTAICETAVLAHAGEGSDAGRIFLEEAGTRYVLDWRREDGVTAVLASARPFD
jgi:hypothetical protein